MPKVTSRKHSMAPCAMHHKAMQKSKVAPQAVLQAAATATVH
jgi:hypothetical protein